MRSPEFSAHLPGHEAAVQERGRATPEMVAFVACIEPGALEVQTLRLFESLRRFGGRLSHCPAYAVAPRPGPRIDGDARNALHELGVHYIEGHFNRDCAEYGSANRVAAAAHVEANFAHEILVVLDSDTVFLREPTELLLHDDVDAAVRPTDLKGICTEGEPDPCDLYWQKLCSLAGIDYASIPWTCTTVDGVRIKASYNGGLVVTRSRIGMLQHWAEIFFSSARAGLAPRLDTPRFRAGVGWVESDVGRWWGSNQAALSLALWSRTDRVVELPETYNYPLHFHGHAHRSESARDADDWVHVHYHWLFDADQRHANPLLHDARPTCARLQRWLAEEAEDRDRAAAA
jgi:hypothetical protein